MVLVFGWGVEDRKNPVAHEVQQKDIPTRPETGIKLKMLSAMRQRTVGGKCSSGHFVTRGYSRSRGAGSAPKQTLQSLG